MHLTLYLVIKIIVNLNKLIIILHTMITQIASDIFQGIKASCSVHLILDKSIQKSKFIDTWRKILIFNFLCYIIPQIVCTMSKFLFMIDFTSVLFYLNYLIFYPSIFFHVIWYMELIGVLNSSNLPESKSKSKIEGKSNSVTATDSVVTIVFMFIYQIVTYSTASLINIVLSDRIIYLKHLIIFFVLCTYHSIYAWGNLWQREKLSIENRLDLHEKKWPYFFGYGIIISTIYFHTHVFWMMAIYNAYTGILLCIPFLISFDKSKPPYQKINLSIFPYMINLMFKAAKFLILKSDVVDIPHDPHIPDAGQNLDQSKSTVK